MYEIKYSVVFDRKLTQKQSKEFENKSADSKFTAQTYEHPESENYNLKLGDNFQILQYEEKMATEENKSKLNVANFPMGKISYRNQKENVIYYQFNFDNKNIYSKENLQDYIWNETGKDSLILKYNAKQLECKLPFAKITAWYVKELPKKLGLYNLSFNDGFVIAYEMLLNEDEFFSRNLIKIYPTKIKKSKTKLEEPVIEKAYTKLEIKKMFTDKNKLINQPNK